MDMVVPNVNPINTIGVFHNTSTSGTIDGTTFAARDDFTSSTNPRDVVLADLDGDGKLDIAAPNASVHTVSVFRNTTIPGDIDANSFTAAQDFFSAGSAPNGVAAGDIDGDGKIDLAISDQTTHTVSVFRNTNTAGTNDASSFAGAVSFAIMPPTLADLDGDGKLDMAVSSFGTDQVGVFRNTSTSGTINASTFATRVDYTTGDGPQKIAAGDLDGDGKPELVVENQVGSTVSIFKNNSVSGTIDASSFAAKLDVTPGSTPAGVAIGDLDGDGRPDLAVANNGSNSLSIFHNQSDLETVGLSGTTTVSPGSEVQLFRIGLVSYGSYTLNGISVTLSDLSSTTGITSSDLELRMYRSTDETFDSGDTQIGTQSTVNLGSTTTISPSTSENPVDHSFYVVTAFINSSANDGNAFKLGFAQNGVTTSAGGEGAAIAASDGNNITSVVTATKWVFTAQPTGATHLQELTPQPGLAARDDNGNLDVNINGTVTLSVSPSGSLSQSTFTAANGLVPTGNVTISGAGSRTLIATGLGLTPDTTAAFEVAKAAATVTLNNLLAVSDGNPKIGGATTDPPGLEVIFTHNEFGVPLDSPPVEPGAYGVTGTVNDPNYQGSATGTLHILLDDPPKAGFAASATQGNSPFTATFTDRSSGQVDTWFLEPGADNGRVYESRNDSVTVTYSTPGTYTVFLTVRGGGFTDQTSLDIIVNGPPNLENIADASANEDETLVLDLSGIDAETGTWTLSGTDQTLISASSIEGDQITFTPVPHANGSDVVTITRTNVHSLSTSQDVTLTWVPVDDAPTIVDLASTYSAAEDNAIHVGAVANVTDLDSDVGTLVWSASGFDGVLVGSTTASNNGVDLTPAVNAFGDTKATIIVTDPATGATATQDVTLIWTRVNDRPSTPVVGFPADGMTDAPLAPLFSWSARDVDFDALVFDLFLGPTGSSLVQVASRQDATSYSSSELSPGTSYTWVVLAHDPSGATAEASFAFTTEADLRAPLISNVGAAPTERSVTFSWSTDEPATSVLQLTAEDGGAATVNPNPGQLDPSTVEISASDLVREHQLTAEDLRAGIWFGYEIRSTDALGNESEAYSGRVLTLAAPDRTAPLFLVDPYIEGITPESAVVRWSTDEPADSRVRFSRLAAAKATLIAQESASAAADFTTAAESDVTAPNITSGPSFQGITETGVTIVWTTDEPASSLVDWSIDPAADPAAAKVAAKKLAAAGEPAAKVTATAQTIETLGRVERGELVQQHRMTLAELLPGTTYHIVVTSKDLLSNSVTTDPNGTELFSRHHQFNTRGSSDREAPTFAVNPTVTWTNSTAVVAWGTNERAASRVDWRGGGERDFVEDNALVQDHSLTVTGLKSRTAYRFLITAQDQAGNKLTWGSLDGPMKPVEGSAKILQPPGGGGFFVTENVADSQLPLIIDGPRVREKTASSLTIGWDTDELADSFVRYGPTDELDNVVGSAQDVTQHSVTVTNLEAGQPYFYQISSTDPSGNGATESSVAVVSTAPEVDLVPPRFVEEPTVAASTDDEIVLSWRTDEAAAARIEFASPEGEMFTRQVDRRQATQQVTLDHLEIDTEYELSIYVNDASQNETPEPFLLRVATDAGPDLEPPRILTGPEVKAITDRSASIVWTTDELADSYVDYHGTPYLGSVVGSPRYSFEHAVMLTNLEPDSTYYFRVGSTDRANNGPTVTAVADFITLEAPDIEPPAAPTELQVTSGFSSILLGWTANEEDDLGGYSVYRETEPESFELVATQLEEPRFLDENLEEGVLYRYRVSAVDQENPPNESLLSEIAEGTPNEANVPGAPEILGLEQGALASRPILVIQNAVPVAAEDVLTYTVQVSTQSSFRDIVARGGNIAEGFGGMTRWRVGKSLIPTARYWWRARASHGPFDGPWSRPVRLRPNQAVVPLTSEDFDGDGAVSFSDFFILANGFGSGDPILDLDRDGTVGRGDLNQLKQKFGSQVASKLLFSQGAEVAAGTAVDVDAEATGGQVRVRMRLAGIPRLSGYGLTVLANPPILRYVGRVDSAVVLGKPNRRLSLVLEADDLLHISDHLKGRVSGVELDESLEIELLFALDGQPQNVELVVQEAFLGRGAGRAWRVETVGRAKVVPRSFALYPNYPNPFNPSTIIPVGIPSAVAGGQELRLYNLLGQVIRRWDLVGWNPGFHRVTWDGKDGEGSAVASGVYLVQLDAGDRVSTQKLMLLR